MSNVRALRRRSRTDRSHRRRFLSPLPPVRENALDQLRLLDARDDVQASAATRALLNLDPEQIEIEVSERVLDDAKRSLGCNRCTD